MPTISLFFGILIRMFRQDDSKQQKQPQQTAQTGYIHATYGNYEAIFTLDGGEIITGEFPPKQTALVKAWVLLHEEDLKANWQLVLDGEEPFRIEPLKS